MNISIGTVKMTSGAQRIKAVTPFHPKFPAKAREIGGTWHAAQKIWTFDTRDEQRVRDLVVSLFGTDGSSSAEVCDIRVSLDRLGVRYWGADLWLVGRNVARRANRDWRVQLGDGVVVVSGGFPPRGGSSKHPGLDPLDETVLEVRDVPKPLVQQAIETYPDAITVVEAKKEADSAKVQEG